MPSGAGGILLSRSGIKFEASSSADVGSMVVEVRAEGEGERMEVGTAPLNLNPAVAQFAPSSIVSYALLETPNYTSENFNPTTKFVQSTFILLRLPRTSLGGTESSFRLLQLRPRYIVGPLQKWYLE